MAEVASALRRVDRRWARHPGGGTMTVTLGGAGPVLDHRGRTRLRARAGRGAGPGRAFTVRGHPRRHPPMPAPASPRGHRRRRRRAGQCLHRCGRAGHACADVRGGHRGARRAVIDSDPQPRVVGRRHLHARGHPARRTRARAVRGPDPRLHRRPHQSARGRERRDADCRPGAPPRGHRVLGRQQVPLPRPVGPGDDRRHALARGSDHQQRDHRDPWHHAGPGAGGCGGRTRAR